MMKDSSNVVKHPMGVVMWGTDIFLQLDCVCVCVCVCVNLTSSAPSLSPPADYQVPGAVLLRRLGIAVNKIKDATLTSPSAQGRPLALLHPT